MLDKAKLIEAVKRCDILLSLLHDTVDRDVLAANPKLKAVSSMNITQDRIDLAAATELGIPVTNIPAIVTDATADIALRPAAGGRAQHRDRRQAVPRRASIRARSPITSPAPR